VTPAVPGSEAALRADKPAGHDGGIVKADEIDVAS